MSDEPTYKGWYATLVRPRMWEVVIHTSDGPRTITLETTWRGRVKAMSGPF